MNREVNWLEYNKILKKSKAENQSAVKPGPKTLQVCATSRVQLAGNT